jgi:type II secretory pathway component PulF
MFANLYSTGEVSGKLDDSLRRLYSHYNEQGTRKLYAFAQWTPRLVYLLVAGIIACKIIQAWMGLYGPHSELSNILNGN